MIDYVFKFASAAAAQADTIVGPRTFSPLLVFNGGNSVNPLSGYWLLIASQPDNALASHANVMIINDSSLARSGLPSCSLAKIDVSNIQIVISPLGTYVTHGLLMIG